MARIKRFFSAIGRFFKRVGNYLFGSARRVFSTILALAATVIVVVCFWKGANLLKDLWNDLPETTIAETTTIEATTEAETSNPTIEDIVREDMEKNGDSQEGEEYVMGEDVDPEKDQSTAGDLAFEAGIENAEEFVVWLQTEEDGALATAQEIAEDTYASPEIFLNTNNYMVLQALTDGYLPKNTALIDGETVDVGNRDIKAGDRFLVFVNPENGLLKYFRLACANPQGSTPQLTPSETTTVPPTTVPSTTVPSTTRKAKVPSEDPYPQGNAPVGGGPNADNGPGEYISPESMVHPPSESRSNPPPPLSTTAAPTTTAPHTTARTTTTTHTTTPVTTTTEVATTAKDNSEVNTSEITTFP